MTEPTSNVPDPPPEAREVILCEYDPAWPQLYEDWSARILTACGGLITEIHHIGSTAVPGLIAEPLIDIQPGVARFEDGFAMNEAMQALGFDPRGELSASPVATTSIARTSTSMSTPSATASGTDQLTFRYAALKRDLQQRHRFDRGACTGAKPRLRLGDP